MPPKPPPAQPFQPEPEAPTPMSLTPSIQVELTTGVSPWSPAVVDFERVRTDTVPIIFELLDGGDAMVDTDATYKMEAAPEPDPADETDQVFALEFSASDTAGTGIISFTPTAADMDPKTDADPPEDIVKVYYQVRQTLAGATRTIIRGAITFLPVVVDKGA